MMALAHRKLWFAVFVVVVFVLGLAAGVAADRYFLLDVRPMEGRMPGGGRPPRPRAIAERMTGELGLTADQRTRLEAVFQRGASRLADFHQRTQQQFEAERRQIQSEIEAVLTPEQRVKFREVQERRQRARPWRRPPGAGPGARQPPGSPPPQP